MTTSDLPAGADLDRLVAEKVMGWKPVPCTCHKDQTKIPGRSNGDGVHFNPSTNIAHAWEVVARFTPRGVKVMHFEEHGTWAANFGYQAMNSLADTAPLAICRAALEAVR